MKKAIPVFVILAAALLFIAARPLTFDSPSYAYCEVVVTARAFSNKVTVAVDYGQETRMFSSDAKLRDEETGKFKRFNSAMDAMNYLGDQGWELVDVYILASDGESGRRFVFKIPLD